MSAGFPGYKHFFRHPVTNEYLWKYGTRTFFPNIKLAVTKGKPNQTSVGFRTTANLTKFEIKQFLTSVYGIHVKKVNTLNYEPALGHYTAKGPGRKGRRYKKRNGFKKAYVSVSDTPVNSIIYKMKEHAADMQLIADHYKNNPPAETPEKEPVAN